MVGEGDQGQGETARGWVKESFVDGVAAVSVDVAGRVYEVVVSFVVAVFYVIFCTDEFAITDIFAASLMKAITVISFVLADVNVWREGEFLSGIDINAIEADNRRTSLRGWIDTASRRMTKERGRKTRKTAAQTPVNDGDERRC